MLSVPFRKIVCEFGPVRANIFFGRGFANAMKSVLFAARDDYAMTQS